MCSKKEKKVPYDPVTAYVPGTYEPPKEIKKEKIPPKKIIPILGGHIKIIIR